MKTNSRPPASEGQHRSERQFSISSRVIPGLMIGLDSLVILSSALISYLILVGHSIEPSEYVAAIAFVWLVAIMLMNFAGLYEFEAVTQPLAFSDRIIIVFVTTFFFMLAAAFALRISSDYSRVWTGSFALSACIGTLLFRLMAAQLMGYLVDRQVFSRNVVIIGSGAQAQKLLARIDNSQRRFITVLGLFAEDSDHEMTRVGGHNMLGAVEDLPFYLRNHDVDDVVICLPWSADDQIAAITATLRELPVNVYLGADLIGFRLPTRPAPGHFGELPLVEVMGRPLAGWGGVQKAALDYGVGIILTILLMPLLIMIVFAIRLESSGPALFRQRRYGFVNRTFDIYKFRTMRYSKTPEEKIVQATRNDPRITRIGRLLRRLSLDELPQIFNVLNGTMSLVGPRPHAVQHNEEYARVIRGYFARHRVKPGMTGWAQVNGFRGEIKTPADMEARVQYDIYYAENWSLLFDLKILAMTAVICVTGRNAY